MFERFRDKEPHVDSQAFVHARALLIGDVHVGARSSIWPHTTLRGDDGPIVIGEESSIQDNTVIHCYEGFSQTTVGNRVTVGHHVTLHGCRIDDESLIGMGSVILDNVQIGRHVLVAAGTVIPPGKVIPDSVLVRGNPGTIVRECTSKDLQLIDMSWRAYVKRIEDYR